MFSTLPELQTLALGAVSKSAAQSDEERMQTVAAALARHCPMLTALKIAWYRRDLDTHPARVTVLECIRKTGQLTRRP